MTRRAHIRNFLIAGAAAQPAAQIRLRVGEQTIADLAISREPRAVAVLVPRQAFKIQQAVRAHYAAPNARTRHPHQF